MLIRLHTQSIAFENLNALMRLPVPLDLDSLEAKLVHARRGGYCFEQNGLFAAVLEAMGFAVRRLAARVVWGHSGMSAPQNPRTHMVLLVDQPEQTYLCDVGFGGITPTAPLVVSSTAAQATPHESFRVLSDAGTYRLQVAIEEQWRDVYLFDLQQQEAADYEMANHYVCSHPASHFRNTLIAARAFEGGRYALRNYVLTTYRTQGATEERLLDKSQELSAVLEERFGILVPDENAFREAVMSNLLIGPAGASGGQS